MGIKISELNEAGLPLDGTEDLAIVEAGVTKRCSTQDIANLSGKVYHALLSFDGTNNPTVAALYKDDLGGITWIRTSTGTFYGNANVEGVFTDGKTATNRDIVLHTEGLYIKHYQNNSSQIILYMRNLSGNALEDGSPYVEIKITVY